MPDLRRHLQGAAVVVEGRRRRLGPRFPPAAAAAAAAPAPPVPPAAADVASRSRSPADVGRCPSFSDDGIEELKC